MKLQVFNIRVSLVSVSRLAGEERIKEILDIDELPQDVRPLLKQEVLPREAIAPLNRCKARATRALLRCAVKNPLGGWNLIPERASGLLAELEDLKHQFYSEKRKLIQNLPNLSHEHIAGIRSTCEEAGYAHTEAFIQALTDAQPTTQYLDDHLKFEYLKPRYVEYDDTDEAPIIREGVFGQVLHEIATRAQEAARAKAVKSRLRAVDEVVAKFTGLGYIEPKLARIGVALERVVAPIPRDLREIDYPPLQSMAVAQIMSILSDEDGLANAVEAGETLFPVEMGDSDQADEQGDLVSEMQETQTELVSESESAPGDVAPVVTADADRDAISQPIDTLYATSTTAVDETDEDAETATEALPPPIPAASPRVAPTYNW